jgi:hypothetical protein
MSDPSLHASVEIDALAPYHVVADFCPEAGSLREGIESHFADPYTAGPAHQVWDYWYVPDSYTYLRTAPEKVIEIERVDHFIDQLKRFALRRLGMDTITWPFLSLYVEGCKQILHNDSRNGSFGYVYSLTRWDERRFDGGETLIFHEQDYWASGRFRDAGAGTAFYEKIPSRFNQLLVFDDRLIHGVPEVRGTTDPREGRIVMHGHMESRGVSVEGPLQAVLESGGLGNLDDVLATAQACVAKERGRYHGFATIGLDIAADGTVVSVQPLVQRVLSTSGAETEVPVLSALCRNLSELRFAPQAEASWVAVPLNFE